MAFSPSSASGDPRRGLAPAASWGALGAAVAVPTVLAGLDLFLGVRLTQLLVVGPCLAAISSRARQVAAVALYVVVLMSVLSGANGNRGLQAFCTATGGLLVGAVCVALAARRDRLQHSMAASERSRSTLAAIVESADEAIVGCAPDGVISTWNGGAERLYGYPAAEAVGRSVEFVHPHAWSDDRVGNWARAVGDRAVVSELTGVHRDGSVLEVSSSISPVRDRTGEVVGISAFVRDIGPVRRAAAERARLEQQLYQFQRVESLGQLAGGIAHDFNNLLAVITTSTDFILEESGDPGAVRADAAQIRTAADRGAQLTRQLLLFARGEHLPAQTVDLDRVIEGMLGLLERSAGPEIDVQTHSSGTPPTVHADVGRMEQVLLNLVINARDAMPNGGRLLVATEVVGLRGDEPGLNPRPRGGPHVVLSVRDDGTGMTPEVAAQVFEPFFSTKSKGTGTGLGLATVWGIVTEARGSVAVDTAPGAGTTFRLYFPLVAAQSEPVPVVPLTAPTDRGSARILVVEDEDPIRELVARILRRAGHRVTVAGSGPEALAMTVDSELDLLITDIVMPVMSGQRLAELIVERQPGLPVIFMSGYSGGVLDTRGTRGARRQLAARGVLEKPFTERQLMEQVRSALATAATADRNALGGDSARSASATPVASGVGVGAGLDAGIEAGAG